MRGLGGAIVLLVIGVACAPVGSAQRPVEVATADGMEAPAPADVQAPSEEAPPAAAPEPSAPWVGVRDVRVEPVGAGRRLVVGLTRAPDGIREFLLADPPRLVIDVRGPQAPVTALTRFPLTDDVVERVRVAANGGALRIVADLRKPAGKHHVRQDGTSLVADLGDTGARVAQKASEGAAVASAITTEPLPMTCTSFVRSPPRSMVDPAVTPTIWTTTFRNASCVTPPGVAPSTLWAVLLIVRA